jgi:hypothetical protein
MSFPKLLVLIGLVLFGTIGVAAFFKKGKSKVNRAEMTRLSPIEVELGKELKPVEINGQVKSENLTEKQQNPEKNLSKSNEQEKQKNSKVQQQPLKPIPEANRIAELFNKNEPKLPIVETIVYKPRVAWQKGRPAWLSDYASHYATSRHFIARSLNQKADYFKQDITEGDQFNVLKPDVNLNFYLLIDLTRSKMWFYYLDLDKDERVLLKTYNVGLGRPDSEKVSGLLTPVGKYSLGNKIAIYKPKALGFHGGQQIEMMRVFGSRWIPFEKEVAGCSHPAKGFGIHGVPWVLDKKGELVEDLDSLGKYESDGCIRLATADIEELFAIIITKPTYVELVKDFYDAKLPGIEK